MLPGAWVERFDGNGRPQAASLRGRCLEIRDAQGRLEAVLPLSR